MSAMADKAAGTQCFSLIPQYNPHTLTAGPAANMNRNREVLIPSSYRVLGAIAASAPKASPGLVA